LGLYVVDEADTETHGVHNRLSADGRWDYAEAAAADELTLDVRQTAVPPKKILFPQREVFAEFSETVEGTAKTLEVKETLPEDESVVIFGVRPCEGRAAWLLDKVFSGEFTDPYYWKRRNQTTLVGLACGTPPSENCFCTSESSRSASSVKPSPSPVLRRSVIPIRRTSPRAVSYSGGSAGMWGPKSGGSTKSRSRGIRPKKRWLAPDAAVCAS